MRRRLKKGVGDSMHPVVRAILQSGATVISAMRIATSTTETDTCGFYRPDTLNTSKTASFKCEVKAETSGTDVGQSVIFRNGVKQAMIGIKADSIICNYLGTSPHTHSIDMTAKHELRIDIENTTSAKFYADGTLIHTAAYADLVSNAVHGPFFGDAENSANKGGSFVWYGASFNLDTSGGTWVTWTPASEPTSQGWTLFGTDLATIIEE